MTVKQLLCKGSSPVRLGKALQNPSGFLGRCLAGNVEMLLAVAVPAPVAQLHASQQPPPRASDAAQL